MRSQRAVLTGAAPYTIPDRFAALVQAIRDRLECAYQQRPHHGKSGGGFCASGKWKSIEGPEQSDTTETKRPTGEVNHRQAML
jgi:hypothetical protein